MAVVTHGGGKKLDEPLIIRPTSETIIYSMFAKWVQSYRDLPLLINQWANVVRWEMRTRLFLRTLEFLWQEGHTAHATHDEAEEEARRMLGVYSDFMEGHMAMPVITGQKTDAERFAGALRTYSCEAMMQDNKALQAGTSHNLGQNFAKAFDLKFQAEHGGHRVRVEHELGRVDAPRRRTRDDARRRQRPAHSAAARADRARHRADLQERRRAQARARGGRSRDRDTLGDWERRDPGRLRVHLDDREGIKPGAKYYEWELRGIPLRMELGPRDLEKNQGVLVRRDTREKKPVSLDTIGEDVAELLMRDPGGHAHRGARAPRAEQHSQAHQLRRFPRADGRQGRVRLRRLVREPECEAQIKEETKATIRVLPDEEFRSAEAPATCLKCGRRVDRRGRMGQSVLTTGFSRVDGVMHCEGVSLERIAARRRYAGVRLQRRDDPRSVRAARPHARAACRIAFTTRSRPTRAAAILEVLRELGAGVDVVSGGELHRALAAGFRAVGHHLRRRRQDGARARARRSTRTSCSSTPRAKRKCALIDRLAGERGLRARVSLRVNPEITLETPHDYIKTGGRGHKFGIPHDDVVHVAEVAAGLAEHVDLDRARHAPRLAAVAHRSVSRGHGAPGVDLRRADEARHQHARIPRHRRRARRSLRHRAAAGSPALR